MPGCSLLELPVLGICVLTLLQLAPCKMILSCMSLGCATTSLFPWSQGGERRESTEAWWDLAQCHSHGVLWANSSHRSIPDIKTWRKSLPHERESTKSHEKHKKMKKKKSWKGLYQDAHKIDTFLNFVFKNKLISNYCFCNYSKIGNLSHNSTRRSVTLSSIFCK